MQHRDGPWQSVSAYWLGGVVSAVSVITLIVAIIAASAAIYSARLQRRTGKETVAVAARSAAASELSATASKASSEASERSAKAAEDNVAVNERTAAGVATRAHAEALAKRYQDAAMQLGHAKAPVRLAGAYALTRLANDWADQRQECVDVLCAYLRMPWNEADQEEDRAVRRSIVRTIENHIENRGDLLKAEIVSGPWSDLDFDFQGATLRDFHLRQPVFDGAVSFDGATFVGLCGLSTPAFLRGPDFHHVVVDGELRIDGLTRGMFFVQHLTVSDQGSLFIRLGRRYAHIAIHDSVINGRMHLAADLSHTWPMTTERLNVGPNADVTIEASQFPEDKVRTDWLTVEGWTVEPGASVRLPVGAQADWIKDEPRDFELNFGPLPLQPERRRGVVVPGGVDADVGADGVQ